MSGRLTNGYNALENNDFPDDDSGHGIHVSGIIASENKQPRRHCWHHLV
ncbi:hypothetical protein ACWE42_24895 [Sutcliffiella cohnii]